VASSLSAVWGLGRSAGRANQLSTCASCGLPSALSAVLLQSDLWEDKFCFALDASDPVDCMLQQTSPLSECLHSAFHLEPSLHTLSSVASCR
jgi:hypothetical protein